jgi:hypothetical protein
MAWKVVKIGEDTQVCNAPCIVKKVALYHTSATTAVIYNEKDSDKTAGNMIFTLGNTTSNLHAEIDFGDKGAFFNEGLYIDWNAGMVLVEFNPAG